MNDDFYVDGKYIFGHVKTDNKFYSTVSVKELLLKNRDVFAAGVVQHATSDIAFYSNNEQDPYIRASAYWMAILNESDETGDHYGDCTKACGPCTLCHTECIYLDGLSDLIYFETLLRRNNLQGYDTCILFMTICQFTEEYWTNYINTVSQHYKSDIREFNYDTECPTYEESLKVFLAMPEEEQLTKYNRMKLVREYIENPTPIENIPWW